MTQVYDLLDKIKDELRANHHMNSVSFGDITEVNLNKMDIFPLSHSPLQNQQLLCAMGAAQTLCLLF